MKRILKNVVNFILRNTFGKKRYQKFYQILYNLSIKGFNLQNHDILLNGELVLIQNLFAYFKKRNKQESQIIFDVGANTGKYSKRLIEYSGGINFSLYAFEPLPFAFNLLKEEFSGMNNSSLKAYNFGFGSYEGDIDFFADHESSELGSFYNRDYSAVNLVVKPFGKITIKRLDNFCIENQIKHIDYLKIDVEGAEIEVIKGAISMFKNRDIDFFQFEFGTGNIESKTYLKDFFNILSNDYVLFRVLKDGLLIIDKYNSDYEILKLGNYFGISRDIYNSEAGALKNNFNF